MLHQAYVQLSLRLAKKINTAHAGNQRLSPVDMVEDFKHLMDKISREEGDTLPARLNARGLAVQLDYLFGCLPLKYSFSACVISQSKEMSWKRT